MTHKIIINSLKMSMEPLPLDSLDFSTLNTYIICQIWTWDVEVMAISFWTNLVLTCGSQQVHLAHVARHLAPNQHAHSSLYARETSTVRSISVHQGPSLSHISTYCGLIQSITKLHGLFLIVDRHLA